MEEKRQEETSGKAPSAKEVRRRRGTKRKSLWRFVVYAFLFFAMVIAGGAVCGFYYVTYDLPKLFNVDDYRPPVVSRVYADDGTLIGEFYKERRVLVPYARIPKRLVQAFVAAEDSDFFRHPGIDIPGIIRAFIKNIEAGRIVQGGSTITQQVTRSLLLTPEKSYMRKIKEMVLAYRLERNLSKEQILAIYLNQIYLGHGAYGVEAASNAYFGKSVEDLNLAETAMMAGLPQAPSRYSPFSNFRLAAERQHYVLHRMVDEGDITPLQAERAKNTPVRLRNDGDDSLDLVPYFSEQVRRYLEQKYGSDKLLTEGLRVYTTVNVGLQKEAQAAIAQGLLELDKRIGYRGPMSTVPKEERQTFCNELTPPDLTEGSIVTGMVTKVTGNPGSVEVCLGGAKGVISVEDMAWARKPDPEVAAGYVTVKDPATVLAPGDVVMARILSRPEGKGMLKLALEQSPEGQSALMCMEAETGYVKAMVGGRDYRESQFNRAIQARRQPGSAFKPIVFAAAMDKGFTPVSVIIDSPVVYDVPGQDKWKPMNYEKKFYGPTLLRTALIHSRNVVAVKLGQEIGVDYIIKYARKLGFTSELVRNLSLALGASDVTLQELVRAYSAFCTGGDLVQPIFVTKVTDRDGEILEENIPMRERVISPETAAIMTSLLQSVVTSGTGQRVKSLKRPVAGKTGTTNDLKDAWFIGFTPHYITGVWVGFDDHRPMGRFETGAKAAIPIWLTYMEKLLEGKPVEPFAIPEGVVLAKIDPENGHLAPPDDRNAVFECFRAGTEPKPGPVQTAVSDQNSLDFFKRDLEASSQLH